ncbi:hypothetical protein OIU78_025690 [Salix suchowensis]|nr:hypothetical protein OIU78_025690 [Salix suchowensis]
MTGGEFFLTGENVAPGMPMPDAPETGLGTEPADQPFDIDMSNISSSLMQSVAEGPNAASTPLRGLANEQEEQPRLDDGRGGMDILTSVEAEFVEEPGAPVVLMTDEPETRQRTEQAHQSVAERGSSSKRPVERSVPSSSNNEATNAASTPARGLAVEQEEQPLLDDGLGGMDILIGGETELVEEPRAPVKYNVSGI